MELPGNNELVSITEQDETAISHPIVGNYRLLRLLARNATSEIYLAEHQEHQAPVAIKLIDERYLHPDLSKFFARASRLARLRHPHITQLLDFGMQDHKGYLVMEYAANGTLRQHHPKGSVLTLETVMGYVRQIADALQYIHQHELVHCDIKPQNLLLNANNEVQISDFGIAVVSHSLDPLSATPYDFEGTVIYAAPEQLEGKPRRSSDQYALGVVTYEWLCGERPFTGTFDEIVHHHFFVPPPPLRERNPTLSAAIEQVVMKALAKKVEARFPTIEDFARALEWAIGQFQETHASQPTPEKQPHKRQFLSPLPFAKEFP
jgi:serine/threonine protein kinase